ncbi:hypothetical protein C1I58_26095 [Bacillus sp. PIC28]|nr:hypothetical protein C1I58_26095 [Bacillus sp. PIC28]
MNQYIRYTIAVLFAIIGGTICLADVFNLLQDNEEDSGRQIESNS